MSAPSLHPEGFARVAASAAGASPRPAGRRSGPLGRWLSAVAVAPFALVTMFFVVSDRD